MSLKNYRKLRGMTQKEMAEMLGVSEVAVWAWETGKATPGIKRLKDVAKAYGCPVEELLTNENK